ncbi:HPr-rel-A system PqqD family peptide chaperone [Pacificimonas sp. WHA3]|uniref:HPr-rel-A system PqqD family peptide chaperone n=1 Tax=Pacificimonas pallii TaxID=2827236 RepID=A0ABS6SFV6_9SPHN|nr:HPr-rel-A system PqqD family peptide chaperone [Pacificimonas pallii]MBV7256811.1 HPr-rel-A system PqqD family peptide chaperone [Pacificimonas pallii]
MSGARYIPARADLRVEPLEDLTLVFHRLSGETHILSPEMEMMFSHLPDAGIHPAGLLRTLETEYGAVEAEDGDALAVISQRLEELAALGLVIRAA